MFGAQNAATRAVDRLNESTRKGYELSHAIGVCHCPNCDAIRVFGEVVLSISALQDNSRPYPSSTVAVESTTQGNPASARSRDGPVDTWDADGCPRGPAESRVERITHSHPPGDTRRHLDRGAGVCRVRPYDGQRRVVIRRRRARAGAAAVPCVPGAPINGGHLGTRSVIRGASSFPTHPPLSLCLGFPCIPERAIMCGILAVLGCSDESQAKRVRVLELSRRQSSPPSPPSLLSV
ncbi:hypothetical protein C4D60_Mb05t29910 [Musa balbisiana]|uniref:Uncharacterized protein n=1 Tax=Musa balbisiana TaxID=52838 RepID=A0A4S8JZU1_MUSBA|nr:hypothetical protein C4D60_Mb05t29910 [Musa balbisiana]